MKIIYWSEACSGSHLLSIGAIVVAIAGVRIQPQRNWAATGTNLSNSGVDMRFSAAPGGEIQPCRRLPEHRYM